MYCAMCGIKIPHIPEQLVRMTSTFMTPGKDTEHTYVHNEMNCGFCRNCGALTVSLISYLPDI